MNTQQNISQYISAELVNSNHENIGMPPEVVLEKLIASLKDKKSHLGEFVSKNLDRVKKVGDTFIKTNYIIDFEKMEIDFSFLYIKPNSRWQIHNFALRQKQEQMLSVA